MSQQPLLKENISLQDYCTYGIGGPADYFAKVTTQDEMIEVVRQLKLEKIPYIIIGKGSNVLFDDKGYRGAVIINKLQSIEFNGNEVTAGAGTSFALLGSKVAAQGFGGLEFAAGIPGSVGGAVFMNAGAGGGETKDTIKSVTFLNEQGEIEELSNDALEFSYRTSVFQRRSCVILSASFDVQPSESAKQDVKELVTYRLETQPYKAKTCGCVFRNPEGKSAAQLIDKIGLKGFSVGGARVSPTHANFLENHDGASSQDILDLMRYVQMKVQFKTGIALESEVRYIPEGATQKAL